MRSSNTTIMILKITLGVALSLIATQLLGFGRDVTAPMAVILILTLSPALHNAKENALSELMGNLIGIPLGIIFPMVIPNYALAVTLAVFCSLFISYKLPWYTSFITSSFTVMLVIYIGSNISPMQYGESRILLVILGLVIGYLINNLIYPPSFGQIVHTTVKTETEKILTILKQFILDEDWQKISTAKLLELEANINIINQSMEHFRKDINSNKRLTKAYRNKKDSYEALIVLLGVCFFVLYKVTYFHDSFNTLPKEVRQKLVLSLERLIQKHEQLLNCFYEEKRYIPIDDQLDENINISYNYHEMAFKGSIAEYKLELGRLEKIIITKYNSPAVK